MSRKLLYPLAILAVAALVASVTMRTPEDATGEAARALLARLAGDPALAAALAEACAEEAPAPDAVAAEDAAWVEAYPRPTALGRDLMAAPLSVRVLELVRKPPSADQVMVTDCRGRLAGMLRLTHDYDQSDEPKFRDTVGAGREGVLDEGWTLDRMDRPARQLSQMVRGPGQHPVGVVTVILSQ